MPISQLQTKRREREGRGSAGPGGGGGPTPLQHSAERVTNPTKSSRGSYALLTSVETVVVVVAVVRKYTHS